MSTAAAPRPSPEKIFEALTRYQQTFALKAGIEVDLFTAIGEGANEPAALAKRTQTAERGIRILADYLAIQGFLNKENGKYSLTPDSAVFLDKRSPAYMGAMAEFLVSGQNLDNMQILTASVRKGGTASGIGDNSKPEDERWVNFARSMGSMAVPMAGVLAQMIAPGNGPVRVLDIAAGHGMYGITVAKILPNVQVTALDWPAVLEVAKENASKAGILDRYATRHGSAFDADLGEGYDYIFITNFLHHFDPPTNETLLRRFHAALRNTKRCTARRDSRAAACIQLRICHSKWWSRRSSHEEIRSQVTISRAESRRFATRALGCRAEGRKRACGVGGCPAGFSGPQTRRLCARPSAYRLAIAGTLANRPVGHPGIQPERKACVARLPGWLLASHSGAAFGAVVGQKCAESSQRSGDDDSSGCECKNGFAQTISLG